MSPPIDSQPINPVLSYVTVDHNTGQLIVVNVTLPGHSLWPGYTARVIDDFNDGDSTMTTYGEGLGGLQADKTSPQWVRDAINNVWFDNQEDIIGSCGCK